MTMDTRCNTASHNDSTCIMESQIESLHDTGILVDAVDARQAYVEAACWLDDMGIVIEDVSADGSQTPQPKKAA